MDRLRQLFAQWAGEPCRECLALGAGGSSRRYYRLVGNTHRCIGAVGDNLRENNAFFTFTRHFGNKKMPVPELYLVDDDGVHYLQQDLGDLTLYDLLRQKKQQGGGFDAEMLAYYRQALSDLDALQRAGKDIDLSCAFPRAAFDRRSILWDLNYFKYNFLKIADISFDEELLENDFQRLADMLLSADTNYFMFRDFQGRNIMVNDGRLYYIDYQGGRMGAAQYDVASLLYSAKSDLPQAIRNELLQHYVKVHGDPDFLTHYPHYVLIRILQTLGAYGYRGLIQRKAYFIQSIPLAINNLRVLLQDSSIKEYLPELERVLQDLVTNSRWATNGSVNQSTTEQPLTVTIYSFSYKLGLPEDTTGNGGGHLFDCRALPNPGRYEQYRAYTGTEQPVIDFLRQQPEVDYFLDHTQAIVEQSINKYLERHFNHLLVAYGCTGGQHRSVYCANQLAQRLQEKYPQVIFSVKRYNFAG